jgi:hypothetical protein
MAVGPKLPGDPNPIPGPYHVYHAEAHVLSGRLEHPVKQVLETYGRVVLENGSRDDHITATVGETILEGLISFKRGHTCVSGSQLKNKKDLWGNDHSGWITLSTSVIEDLNVFEVITVDRMVAQGSTEHAPISGHVPKVTFLGTRFENLSVGGYPVQVQLDLDICGQKPQGDLSYLEDSGFLDRVRRQLDGIARAKGLPESLRKQYDAKIACIDDLRKRAGSPAQEHETGNSALQCSLVKSIEPIPLPGVKTFGNLIFIPDFGTLSLAEVEVGIEVRHTGFAPTGSLASPSRSNYFALDMLNINMGCIAGGKISAGRVKFNGQTNP